MIAWAAYSVFSEQQLRVSSLVSRFETRVLNVKVLLKNESHVFKVNVYVRVLA